MCFAGCRSYTSAKMEAQAETTSKAQTTGSDGCSLSDMSVDEGTPRVPVDGAGDSSGGAGVDVSTVSAEDDVIRTLDIDDSQLSSCTGDAGNDVSDVTCDDSKDNSRTCSKKLTSRLVNSSCEERDKAVSNDIQHDDDEHVEDDSSEMDTDTQKTDDIGDKNSTETNHCTDVVSANNSDTKAPDSDVDLDMSVDVSDDNSKHNDSGEKTPTKNNKENNCDDSFEKNTSDHDDVVAMTESHKKVSDNVEERRPRKRGGSEPSGKDVESTTSVLKEKLLQGSTSKEYDCKDDDEDYDDDEIDISGIDVSQDDFEVVATLPTKKRQKKRKSQFGMSLYSHCIHICGTNWINGGTFCFTVLLCVDIWLILRVSICECNTEKVN